MEEPYHKLGQEFEIFRQKFGLLSFLNGIDEADVLDIKHMQSARSPGADTP